MIHPRLIDFTNAELVGLTPDQHKLKQLADFLWTDPRPHAEGKFRMDVVSYGWDNFTDPKGESLAHCGTAACAAGWATVAIGWNMLFTEADRLYGERASTWMFSEDWAEYDNSPYGASFRIDHFLKHRDPSLYEESHPQSLIERHYPRETFWLKNAA